MSTELDALMEFYEKDKGIDRSVMVEAISNALLAASRKSVGPARELRVDATSLTKGKVRLFAKLIVVEKVTQPYEQVTLDLARKVKPDAVLGDEVEFEVTPSNFGRIAAQTAKQAIMQRLRQAEKEMIYEEFKDRAGDIVPGVIRRFDKSDIIVDLGRFEGVMPAREKVPNEDYQVGERFRFYVVAVENGPRGPEIILSRAHPNFVRRLFESEVSEIADRTVEIRSIAREAGYRTKLAVHASDPRVDPVGACVGLRGARVKNIVRELNNEKVDIIRWTDNIKQCVIEALRPAVIGEEKIRVMEDEHRIEVRVQDDELSKAIGLRGRNARLTSRLLGWDVQVMKDETKHQAFIGKVEGVAGEFVRVLGVDPAQAEALVRAGITSLEVFAACLPEDITGILGVSEEDAARMLALAGSN